MNISKFLIRASYPNYFMVKLYADCGRYIFEKQNEREGNKPGTDKKFAYIHSCYVFSFDTMDNGDFLILLPTMTDYVSTIFCGIPASECEKTQNVQMFLSKQKDSAPNIEFKNFYMPKNSLYRGI